VSFVGTVTPSGCTAEPALAWDFGDGETGHGAQVSHAYGTPGSYDWTLTATADGTSCSSTGTISIGPAGGAAWSAVRSPRTPPAPRVRCGAPTSCSSTRTLLASM
jgi:PKD repeat protein